MTISTLTTTTVSSSATAASAFAISTTFTAPAACSQSAGGLTMLQNREYQIWLNAPVPVPGTTIASCYPSQFMSSYLLEQGGISQSPFSPLVCPEGYTTQGPYTSNYIACCPSGWNGLATNSNAPLNRPAYSGTCYTNIYNKPIKVTLYNDASIEASSIFTATDSLAQAYAYPYEGFAFGVAVLASTTPSQTFTPSPATASPIITSSSAPSMSPSPSSSPSSSSGSSLSGGAIAGIVVGSVVGAFIILSALIILLRYRQRRSRPRQGDMPEYPGPGTPNTKNETEVDIFPDGVPPMMHVASEMDGKQSLHEMPDESRRWHELDSSTTPPTKVDISPTKTDISPTKTDIFSAKGDMSPSKGDILSP